MPHSTATLNSQSTDVITNYWKFGALATGTPTASTAGTEISGGSPAYARIALTNGTPSGGVNVASAVTFNVPASTSPANFEGYSAITAGTYAGWVAFTAIPFSVQGTLAVTPTFSQA